VITALADLIQKILFRLLAWWTRRLCQPYEDAAITRESSVRCSIVRLTGLLKDLTVPKQMSSQDVLRELRRIRFSPRKGRRLGLAWVASQTGYARHSLYRAIQRGWMTRLMAQRIGTVLRQTVTLTGGHSAFSSTLGPLDAGPDPRGGPRPVRRPDDRRLRSARHVNS
jgi:hypothetical protein